MDQILKYSTRELFQQWTKIIHNSHFKRKVSLEEMEAHKEDRIEEDRSLT